MACINKVRTPKFLAEKSQGGPLPRTTTLGDLQGRGGLVKAILGMVREKLEPINPLNMSRSTSNTSVVFHNSQLMALVESTLPFSVRILMDGHFESLAHNDYGGRLKHPFTAHPKVDPETGELLFFGYGFLQQPFCTFSRANAIGELISSVELNQTRPVMMHDFAITEHFAVFLDLPLIFDKTNLARNRPAFDFRPEVRSHLLSSKDDSINLTFSIS